MDIHRPREAAYTDAWVITNDAQGPYLRASQACSLLYLAEVRLYRIEHDAETPKHQKCRLVQTIEIGFMNGVLKLGFFGHSGSYYVWAKSVVTPMRYHVRLRLV